MEETIANLISNVGFPIVVSIALFKQMDKTNETYIKLISEFKAVIDRNTLSINELAKTMGKIDRGSE